MTISQFPLPEGGIPTGNTAGRPANPVIGDVYYNGQLAQLEIFDGTNFIACSAPPGAPSVVSVVDVGTSRDYGSAQATVTLSAGTGLTSEFQAVGTLSGVDYESATTSSTTVTLTVGNSGTYSIGGRGINQFGASITGARTSAALTTVPQAPSIGIASASTSANEATVSWSLQSDGGKVLSAITITPFLNGTTAETARTAATTSSTSYTFTTGQLTAGAVYTFKVKTTNANGTSQDSTASNSVTIPSFITVDYLVIAGGGGGGGDAAGGGGAGGYRTSAGTSGALSSAEGSLGLSGATNYSVTIGAGGAGNTAQGVGTNGSNSIFSTVTSTGGGGGGGAVTKTGANGGCGGGGAYLSGAGGTGTANQGFAGGSGNASGVAGAGGGGAGAVGQNGQGSSVPGAGGAGIASTITGSSVTRAGGGGGGGDTPGGAGGSGGGGAGGLNGGGVGTAGTANTGGGGGAGGGSGGDGGAGGSGVVILRYPDTRTITIGAGLTGTESAASGGYKRATLTAGSGNVSW